jgi:hypothetical protein
VKQGAVRHPLAHRSNDLYETPSQATDGLVRAESLPVRIWEPAAGRGAISRVLVAHGHDVIAQDLVAYTGADPAITSPVDFLKERAPPPGCWCIITNPPYKLADDFVRHSLLLVPRVIMLLRLMALEGASRSDVIDGHLRRVWSGIERLPIMHRDGWSGPKIASAGFPFAWLVFEATRRPANSPIELRRISWRASTPAHEAIP